jgi:hypothetical protein
MNKFISNLIKTSRKKWLYTDKLEIAIFFFIDSNEPEDIARVISNINLFLPNKDNDVYVIDIAKDDINIFKSFEGVQYFKVEGGFQPEKLSSLISDKNLVVGVSSNISLNKEFLDHIDANISSDTFFLSCKDIGDSILFITSRDLLSVKSYYPDSFFERIKEQEVDSGILNVHHYDFKKKSSSDFKVFDRDGGVIDLDNNEIINGMWIGDSLTNVEKLSINSFLKNGHEYHLYVYDDIKGIPDGVIVKDGNMIIDSSKIFKYKKMGKKEGSAVGNEGFAGFADWFRYVLLHKKGGWWSDLDSICLKKFEIPRPYFFTVLKSDKLWFTNGIFKTQKNSLALSYCINSCEEIGVDVDWMDTGPALFHMGYMTHNLRDFSITEEVFDLYRGGSKLFKDRDIDLGEAYSIHMYNSGLSQRGWDKNGVYPENSLFEKLKRKYL